MSLYNRALTPAEAREMRIVRVTTRAKMSELAVLYEVSETTVLSVLTGRSYADAGGPADDVGISRGKPPTHGTPSCYSTGCRHPDCVQANKDRCRAYRQLRRKRHEEEGQ